MGLKDGAQQLMEQQQQAVAEAARAKASLAAATERMLALVPAAADEKDRDVFEGVEAELQGLRRQVEALQQKMKRSSMEEKITARQQELDQQLQKMFPSITLPELPPRSLFSSSILDQMDSRCAALNRYVKVMLLCALLRCLGLIRV